MGNVTKVLLVLTFVFCAYGFASAQNNDKRQNSRVKLLSNPKPTYTPEARRAGISGKVVLKIEFKADETIGEVENIVEQTDSNMEEYGLVNQAIKAAKRIKFMPAMENGQAVTQTKIVVITFNTY